MDITNLALFNSISGTDLTQLLKCCDAQRKVYPKGDFVWLAGDAAKHIGIVLYGNVSVVKENVLGDRHMIGKVGQGHLFGETFACAELPEYPVSVQAGETSEVMLLKLSKVLTQCPQNCGFHTQLIKNLLTIMAGKNLYLNQKIDVLSQKTTRQKVAHLLISHMQTGQDKTVKLPYSREEMADYLGLNRSALSRELGWLKAKGLIDYTRNVFMINDIDGLRRILYQA